MVAAAHLRVPRQHGLFEHHGIDLGDGTVAHYLEGREILRSPLEEFCAGQKATVIMHARASKPRETLSRALSRIGERNYNLLFNNCEHFANWCKTGSHRSHQVEDLLHKSSLGAIAIGQVMPAALIASLKILLSKGLSNEKARQKAKESLYKLKNFREKLSQNLEETLEQIDHWLNRDSNLEKAKNQYTYTRQLLLKGQTIADELTALENLEFRINAILDTTNHQN